MEYMNLINFLSRWLHVLFGIAWIGLLYYFNFIQGGYFKKATPEALKDAKAKLAPSALNWFRWAALATFITGLLLMVGLVMQNLLNMYIVVGATLGTLMFLNVWLIIWPNQKVALGMVSGGDPAAAAGKALLASRTNTLFSAPLVFFMLAGPHFVSGGGYGAKFADPTGLYIVLAIIALLEVNAVVGKQGPMASVVGVIHMSLALTALMAGILVYV